MLFSVGSNHLIANYRIKTMLLMIFNGFSMNKLMHCRIHTMLIYTRITWYCLFLAQTEHPKLYDILLFSCNTHSCPFNLSPWHNWMVGMLPAGNCITVPYLQWPFVRFIRTGTWIWLNGSIIFLYVGYVNLALVIQFYPDIHLQKKCIFCMGLWKLVISDRSSKFSYIPLLIQPLKVACEAAHAIDDFMFQVVLYLCLQLITNS